jgi:hypothetical protein
MRITPRQHIQAAKKPKKANPMARARVARQVPQMRKVFKGVTGVKKGGQMANPMKMQRFVDRLKNKIKNKDRLTEKDIDALYKQKELDKFINTKGRALKGIKELLKMTKFRAGGVIRPKPTFKGKVLKPKPIRDKRGIGIAIRGIGKAFKKGN